MYGQNSLFDLWPWRMTLTLYFHHSKCAASWDAPVHQIISNVYLYLIKCCGKRKSGLFYLYIWPLTLKDDLDKLPLKMWCLSRCICMPMSISIGSNAMAKGKVDFFTYIFDLWPWRMTLTLTNYPSKCAAWADAYACQNIKSLSVMAQNIWPMLKLSSNKQTNRQTNKQADKQTDRAKTICPPDLIWGA